MCFTFLHFIFRNTFRFDLLHKSELISSLEETNMYVLHLMMQSVRYNYLSLVISSMYQQIVSLIIEHQILV